MRSVFLWLTWVGLLAALCLAASSRLALAGAPDAAAPITAPAATPPPLDCANPFPGQVTKIVDDDAIMVACAFPSVGPFYVDKLDNKDDGSDDLVYYWNWSNDGNFRQDVVPGGITTTDLDGDGKDEAIIAVVDEVGRVQAVSLENPEVDDSSQLQFDAWTGTFYGHTGNPVGVAAGNLDGGLAGGDQAGEVVLAFQDWENRLTVILLDGETDGGITYLASWNSTDHGRSSIPSTIAVDVGDVDSDGYDNDIVLAFADGDKDLQVVVLKLNQQGSVSELGWNYWTDNDRGTSVTGAIWT